MQATFTTVVIGTSWFASHALSNISLKQAVGEFSGAHQVWSSFLDLIFLQLLLSAILGKLYCAIVNTISSNDKQQKNAVPVEWTQLIPIVACHLMGTIMTDMSYLMMSASVTTLLKSAEPIFTVVLSILLLKKQYGVTTVAAVFCMVIGIATCVFQSQSVNLTGVVYASISNAAFPLRNVLTKKIQVDTQQAPWEVFTSLSAMGACVVGIVWMGKVALMGVSTQPVTLAASFLFGSYQIFSFGFLGRTSALAHAICNVFKRVVTMTLSVWFFGDVLGVEFYVGISIAFAGLTLYTLVGKGLVSDLLISTRSLVGGVLIIFVLGGVSYDVLQRNAAQSPIDAMGGDVSWRSSVQVLNSSLQRVNAMDSYESQGSDTHQKCLVDIQTHLMSIFSPHLSGFKSILLVDPAFHSNVGDNLLAYGELCLIHALNMSYTECMVAQGLNLIKKCMPSFYNVKQKAMWHAGGNWGDLWDIQVPRIQSLRELTVRKMQVLGMPQSLHYDSSILQVKEARMINDLIRDGLNLTLSWRQQNSFDIASHLYPNANHILSPDIAFMIGPVADTRAFTKTTIANVDILFLLRNDKESVLGSHTTSREHIQQTLNTRNVTWELVDWDDRKRFYNASVRLPPPMQQVPYSNAFDFNARIASSVAMYSTASVIVTDRLHASILALLMNKPHVYMDQVNQKLTRTREVAFRVSESCQKSRFLRYTKASDVVDAVEKAIDLLKD